jgi:hypothetical protein
MYYLFFAVLFQAVSLLQSDTWKPGKTDSKGDLIIVEMENNKQMRDRPNFETVTVDSKWSILIWYDDNIKNYYIFNNKKKAVFSTGSFDTFINELKKIPDHTTIRDIQKCTMPFAYLLPEEQKDAIDALMKKKNCTLEDRIMYCYCGAVKITYGFNK